MCGEQVDDPRSIAVFEQMNVDFVSCAPRRVPIVKIAAAQATIQEANSK